ncbi:MAG: hypothetical protein OEZ04_03640, partial [Nitrospinota bacterium]|nr:hypothetical protein [Nitrospinota bacterium]
MFISYFSKRAIGAAARLPLVLAFLLLTGISGCVQTRVEMVTDDSRLLERANNFYARQRFNQATESYRKVMDEYPDSKYRKVAVIGLADSLYKEGQF